MQLSVLIISDTCGFPTVDAIAGTRNPSRTTISQSAVKKLSRCSSSSISSSSSSSGRTALPLSSSRVTLALKQQQNGDHGNTYSANAPSDGKLTESVIDDIISKIHKSGYMFRIIVIGNGAILETTSRLGPIIKSSVSPKTGQRLVTLASQDQTFEFHIKIDQVKKVVFVENTKTLLDNAQQQQQQQQQTSKVMRICRFLNQDGDSICSLILSESGQEAVEWFTHMKECYGTLG